ncbi:class I SAM-dependent methyltransferase [Desulfitobacterium sp.]|uniref:class I SAM-dependent methyltransferase n=1 Tax=Desulfitobacterium sp. TaxID=49981 RepID=UPI002B8805CB|nr:methyltransferase domain-containing protein [Desulfitobacterium sp.]HVJ48847.1 methyltransferase domain-containing protein [Desulfitobacterium sp.]
MDNEIINHNRSAWDKRVQDGSKWTIRVSSEVIELARKGLFNIKLTSQKPVPRAWFPNDIKGQDILCLASGGGQQGPVLSATGANVTVLDISGLQLKQDEFVARRDNLDLKTVQGDMCDLSRFGDETFDIVFNPVSNTYIPELTPVWSECYRVLKKGGILMTGCVNPYIYIFNGEKWDDEILEVSNKLPYNSLDEIDEEGRKEFLEKGNAIEYSHTLDELIGGQVSVGFHINGFYEDIDSDLICNYAPKYFATRAVKPLLQEILRSY